MNDAGVCAIIVSIVLTFRIAASGSRLRTSLRTEAASEVGSVLVRTTRLVEASALAKRVIQHWSDFFVEAQ